VMKNCAKNRSDFAYNPDKCVVYMIQSDLTSALNCFLPF